MKCVWQMTDKELIKIVAEEVGGSAEGTILITENESKLFPLDRFEDCFHLMVNQDITVEYGYCSDDAPTVTCYGIQGKEFGVTLGNFPDPYERTARCIIMAIVNQKIELDKIMNKE